MSNIYLKKCFDDTRSFVQEKLTMHTVSDKNVSIETTILVIFIFSCGIYFTPIYKSGFIFLNDFDLFKELCQLNTPAILVNKRLEPVFILLGTIFCKFNITQPAVFHYINITLHIANTILIFYFSRSLFSLFTGANISKLPPIICALVFCFHPINADTVFWIYSVKELSLTFLCLLSLINYLDFLREPHKRNNYLLSLLFLTISCLSSRYCFQVFIVYLLLIVILPAKKSLKFIISITLPFLIVCTLAFSIYFWYDFYQYSITSQNSSKDFSIYLTSIIPTINNLIFPVRLAFYTPFPEIGRLTTSNIIVFWFGAGIILATFINGFFRKDRLLLLASVCLITLLILSHLFIESNYLVHANSLNYFLTFGFTIFVGTIFKWVNTNKSIIHTCVLSGSIFIIIITLIFSTFNRMKVWKNEITLWNDVLESYPKNLYAEEQKRQAAKYHKGFILEKYGDERPNIKFIESSIDIGTIINDGIQSVEFKFENFGDKPVIINKVITSCGCTSTQWTNTPVLPNKKGRISANISLQGLNGHFSKSITVLFNNYDDPFTLIIKGQILK